MGPRALHLLFPESFPVMVKWMQMLENLQGTQGRKNEIKGA